MRRETDIERIGTKKGDLVADSVEIADSFLSRMRGYMFQSKPPDGSALVIDFNRSRYVFLHMLFVNFDIEVVFLDNEDSVKKKESMPAWRGFSYGKASRVVEMPEGGLSDVEEGDLLVFS